MNMLIKSFRVGPISANCYVIGDVETKEGAIIDPGDESDRILKVVKENNLNIKYIIGTHGHFDHIGAVGPLKEKLNAPFLLHKNDNFLVKVGTQSAQNWGLHIEPIPEPDKFIDQDDCIDLGKYKLSIIHTPGHTPGGICIYIQSENIVFSGDTLFYRSIGRTDFEGGSMDDLLNSIKTKLFILPENTTVFTGHEQETSIGYEKSNNFFIQ